MNEYLALLRHNRNFRNLWLGSVISQLGDWFNVIAAAELITRLTEAASPSATFSWPASCRSSSSVRSPASWPTASTAGASWSYRTYCAA